MGTGRGGRDKGGDVRCHAHWQSFLLMHRSGPERSAAGERASRAACSSVDICLFEAIGR